MIRTNVEQVRWLVMFVVAWLIGLYVFELVQQQYSSSVGLVAAVATFAINFYARRRAAASVEATWVFKFWLYLPVILFLVVPIIIKAVVYFRGGDDRQWWDHLYSVLPFVLKLGVPVAVLLWVYWSLGKAVRREKVAPDKSEMAS